MDGDLPIFVAIAIFSSPPGVEASPGPLSPISPAASLTNGTHDSNYALLAAALAAARSSGTSYDYVLVAGDYLTHDFRLKYRAQKLADQDFPDFAIKTMVFVSRTIQAAFPKAPVFGVVGNNDSACGDYAEPAHSALFAALAAEWNVVSSRPDAARDFAAGGYYAVPHPTVPKQELIVLNSTFWSSLYHAGCSSASGRSGDAPGDIEMAWLKQQLQQAQLAGKTAVLAMHIPPGFDAFNSSRQNDCAKPTALWNNQIHRRLSRHDRQIPSDPAWRICRPSPPRRFPRFYRRRRAIPALAGATLDQSDLFEQSRFRGGPLRPRRRARSRTIA